MIEEIVIDYLNSINGFKAYAENQTESLEEYIVVQKIGSGEENYINHATIIIQSYAKSLYQAAQLNEKVKQAMRNIIELSNVSKAKLNSDYNYTDTAKKKYRYQAVYEVIYF